MLRRGVILAVVLVVTLGCVVLTTLGVLGSSHQFQSRLQASWSLGRLRIDKSSQFSVTEDFRKYDPRQIQLKKLVVTNQRHKKILRLEDVVWNRVRLFPESDGLDLHAAEVRFGDGELYLSIRDGSQWDHEMILAENPDWDQQIPALVSGEQITVRARRKSSTAAADLELRMEAPRFQKGEDGLSFQCLLGAAGGQETPPWRHGLLRWTRNVRGVPRLEVQVDDADFEHFPDEALRSLFDLPWPREVQFLEGRGALDWIRYPGFSRLDARFHRTRLELPLPNRSISSLRGNVRFEKNGPQRWTIEHGVYSRSIIAGQLVIQPDDREPERHRRRVRGSVTVEHFLEDRDIGVGLPDVWRQFLASQRLGGRGTMTVDVDGVLGGSLASLVRGLRIEVAGAGVRGYDRKDSLTGNFDVVPSGNGWSFSGASEESNVGGLAIPPGRWSGRLDLPPAADDGTPGTTRFRVSREVTTGDDMDIALEATSNDRGGLDFSVRMRGVPLAALLGVTELGAAATVTRFTVEGAWFPGEVRPEVEWDATLEWEGVSLAPDLPWPAAPEPSGERTGRETSSGGVDGYLILGHRSGRTTVRHLQAKGATGSWVAHGYVREGGFWDLTGTTVETTENLFGADTAVLIEEASRRFRIQGPLLHWKIDP